MKIDSNNSVELTKPKREFAEKLIFGLLAFIITFAILRWVL